MKAKALHLLTLASLGFILSGCEALHNPQNPFKQVAIVGQPLPEPDLLGGPAEPRIASDSPARDFLSNLRWRFGLSGKGVAAELVTPFDYGAGVKLYIVTPTSGELPTDHLLFPGTK